MPPIVMPPTTPPFATLRTLGGLLSRLTFTGLILGIVVSFHWSPVALRSRAVSRWIALRTNQDLAPHRSVAVAAGVALRRLNSQGRLARGLPPAFRIVRRIRNRFLRYVFVGRAAWFNTGQCSSLCSFARPVLRAARLEKCFV